MKKQGILTTVLLSGLLTALSSVVTFAQQPIPLGPGPVISVSPSPENNQNENTPLPQGPGPVISISPGPENQNIPPYPTGPGPVVAESPANNGSTPPPPPPGWAGPGFLSTPANPDWQNEGTINVMGTGYDSQGVMKQIPLFVQYQFNGVNYNVTVLNAWNPYTYSWDANVDQPAYQTSYYFNGFTYNYYTVLSTGTFYFNL